MLGNILYNLTLLFGKGRRIDGSRKHGKVTKIRLGDVIFVPELTANLLSVTQVMKNGWKLCGTSTEMTIEKEGSKIQFDNKMKCGSGFVYGF